MCTFSLSARASSPSFRSFLTITPTLTGQHGSAAGKGAEPGADATSRTCHHVTIAARKEKCHTGVTNVSHTQSILLWSLTETPQITQTLTSMFSDRDTWSLKIWCLHKDSDAIISVWWQAGETVTGFWSTHCDFLSSCSWLGQQRKNASVTSNYI